MDVTFSLLMYLALSIMFYPHLPLAVAVLAVFVTVSVCLFVCVCACPSLYLFLSQAGPAKQRVKPQQRQPRRLPQDLLSLPATLAAVLPQHTSQSDDALGRQDVCA